MKFLVAILHCYYAHPPDQLSMPSPRTWSGPKAKEATKKGDAHTAPLRALYRKRSGSRYPANLVADFAVLARAALTRGCGYVGDECAALSSSRACLCLLTVWVSYVCTHICTVVQTVVCLCACARADGYSRSESSVDRLRLGSSLHHIALQLGLVCTQNGSDTLGTGKGKGTSSSDVADVAAREMQCSNTRLIMLHPFFYATLRLVFRHLTTF